MANGAELSEGFQALSLDPLPAPKRLETSLHAAATGAAAHNTATISANSTGNPVTTILLCVAFDPSSTEANESKCAAELLLWEAP